MAWHLIALLRGACLLLIAEGGDSVATLGISRSTLYRYLQGNSTLPAPADIAEVVIFKGG